MGEEAVEVAGAVAELAFLAVRIALVEEAHDLVGASGQVVTQVAPHGLLGLFLGLGVAVVGDGDRLVVVDVALFGSFVRIEAGRVFQVRAAGEGQQDERQGEPHGVLHGPPPQAAGDLHLVVSVAGVGLFRLVVVAGVGLLVDATVRATVLVLALAGEAAEAAILTAGQGSGHLAGLQILAEELVPAAGPVGPRPPLGGPVPVVTILALPLLLFRRPALGEEREDVLAAAQEARHGEEQEQEEQRGLVEPHHALLWLGRPICVPAHYDTALWPV